MSAKDVSDELVKEAWPIAARCVERPYNHGTMTKAALVIAKVLAERDARNERLRSALFIFDVPDETLEGWDDDDTFIALPLANGMFWTITAGAFRNAKAVRAALSEATS